MAVSWMNWYAMISVPVIQDRLNLATRDGGGDGVRRLGVMSLPGSMLVDRAVVNDPPGAAILLGSDYYPAAPGVRSVDLNAFDYS